MPVKKKATAKSTSKTKTTDKTAAKKGVSKATNTRPRMTPVENTGSSADHGKLMEFFEKELKDLYWAEQHLAKELTTMAEKATSVELQQALTEHQSETEEHVERLEQVFEILGVKAEAKKCDAIIGITKEIHEIISETEDDTFTRDVALIVGAQKAEHYEIATYGSLAQLARTLGKEEVADILEETLADEKNADRLLTHIAENHVNEEATSEAEEE